MNIQKFTQKSIEAIQNLEKTAYDFGNQEVTQEHLLYNLLSLLKVGGIALVCLYLMAEGGDFCDSVLIDYEVGECHVGAFSGVLQCDCLSDSS